MLLHIPQVIDAQALQQIRQALEHAQWTDGRETVGPQGAEVKRNLQLPDASPLRQALGQQILQALDRNPLFFAAALPARILPPRFNRYSGGGEYGFHVDGAVMLGPHAGGSGQALRSDISCTLFLSDPDSYDGGQLVVSDTYGEHEVKLPAGDLVLYPASSLHRVCPVTRGERLAAFFWVQSLVRDDTRRTLLLEMDTAIQRLRGSEADPAAVLQLSGVYHNLLRQWAET
jgi:PKHD-type hydroxylase